MQLFSEREARHIVRHPFYPIQAAWHCLLAAFVAGWLMSEPLTPHKALDRPLCLELQLLVKPHLRRDLIRPGHHRCVNVRRPRHGGIAGKWHRRRKPGLHLVGPGREGDETVMGKGAKTRGLVSRLNRPTVSGSQKKALLGKCEVFG